MAYGCALSILGDPELAEDAAQNAFLTTYFTLHKINKPEAFAAWLRRIVSRQCTRMIREQQHYKISADELSDIEDTSDNPYETAAGSQGNLDMATLFVEAGAHINPIEYAHLNSPLSWANYKGHKKIVDYLAQHGGTTHSDEFYVMP